MRKKYIVYSVLQMIFTAIVPLAFIISEYATTSGGLRYKLPLGAIVVAIIMLVISKNTLLKPRIAKLTAVIAQHEGDLKVESEEGKIKNLIAELKHERTVMCILNSLMPILLLGAMLIAAKALESAVMKLSGAIGFSLASFILGTVFGTLAARCVWAKHGGNADETT